MIISYFQILFRIYFEQVDQTCINRDILLRKSPLFIKVFIYKDAFIYKDQMKLKLSFPLLCEMCDMLNSVNQ